MKPIIEALRNVKSIDEIKSLLSSEEITEMLGPSGVEQIFGAISALTVFAPGDYIYKDEFRNIVAVDYMLEEQPILPDQEAETLLKAVIQLGILEPTEENQDRFYFDREAHLNLEKLSSEI